MQGLGKNLCGPLYSLALSCETEYLCDLLSSLSSPVHGHNLAWGPGGQARASPESEPGNVPGWAAVLWALKVNYGTRAHGAGTNHGCQQQGEATPALFPQQD